MQVHVQHVNFNERNFQCTNFTITEIQSMLKAKCRDYYWYFIKKIGRLPPQMITGQEKGTK